MSDPDFEKEQDQTDFPDVQEDDLDDADDILSGFPGSFGAPKDLEEDELEEEAPFEGFSDDNEDETSIADEADALLDGIDTDEVNIDDFEAEFEEEGEVGADDDFLGDLEQEGDEEGDEDYPYEEEDESEKTDLFSKYKKPLATAAAVIVLAVVGFTVIKPTFLDSTSSNVVASTVPVKPPAFNPDGNRAPALPGATTAATPTSIPGLPAENTGIC